MTQVPAGFDDIALEMRAAHDRLLVALAERGYAIPAYPVDKPTACADGQAAALAYPIQGVLKYHGLSDWAQAHRLSALYLGEQRRRPHRDAGDAFGRG